MRVRAFLIARRADRRVEEFRADAAELRGTSPRIYLAILDNPRGRQAVEAGDPEGYVASCLAAAAEVRVEPAHAYPLAALQA